ncbi:MAG TPA: sigma-70 family RNA polymerase sigma factor [Planctomycetota bacterium]|nr:sigma-70 family RNA polymerase sigma factor [Planctomycetota bacterium]
MGCTDTSMHIRGAIAGDRGDLDWTIERLTPMLLAQARYRMRGRLRRICEAEDVVAHAWQVALPRLSDLVAREGRFGPVLVKFLSTAILLRINELLRVEARQLAAAGGSPTGLAERLPDPATGVWSAIVQRERAGIVQRTLDGLPACDREVIVLRLVEQRGSAEVARLLGLTTGAVNVRLHRALGRLREALPATVFDDLAAETEDS